jgi:hypothetical protein
MLSVIYSDLSRRCDHSTIVMQSRHPLFSKQFLADLGTLYWVLHCLQSLAQFLPVMPERITIETTPPRPGEHAYTY